MNWRDLESRVRLTPWKRKNLYEHRREEET